MKNKIMLLSVIVLALMICGTNIMAASDFSFNATSKGGLYDAGGVYSGIESHKEHIGIYSAANVNDLGDPNSTISQLVQKQEVTIQQDELLQLLRDGKILINTNKSYEELEEIYQQSLEYKEKMKEKIEDGQNVESTTILEKGMLIVKVGDVVSYKIPHYLVATVKYDQTQNKLISTPYTLYGGQGDVLSQIDSLTEQIENNTSNKTNDFWGDASTWFGQAQGSGYEAPEQVNEIIEIFEDMINVVGTTVIIAATIILGIKYIIGTVESKTSAKEGLITLLVACVFFFGWTAIKNLLFPENNFIFTSATDTEYTNMVGRLFATFTYIAQFVVIGAIIYVGIKYIFAGADGRAELKAKSVYFIIGIILVFATTNVLTFISDIINEAI